MFCKNCGKEISNDSKFCQFCGTPMDASVATEQIAVSDNIDLAEIFAEFQPWDNHRTMVDVTKGIKSIRGCSVKESMAIYKNALADTTLIQEAKKLRAEWDSDKTTCPKCHGHHVHIDKKGYGLKKGVIGAILLGPVGLIAGKHKSNQLRYTCLDCGHQWTK